LRDRIIVSAPLICMAIEFIYSYVLKRIFRDDKDNICGLALSIATIIFPLEFIRFMCFVLLWLELPRFGDGAEYSDIIWNAMFCVIGEIYSHTSVYQILKNEMEMRLYGRRLDNFNILYHYISSVRSVLEYLAPAVFTSQILLVSWFSNKTTMIDNRKGLLYIDRNAAVIDKLGNILTVYYLLEFVSESLCWSINKRLAYKRISIIGNLNWVTLFLMIVYVGSRVDVTLAIAAFLEVDSQSTETAHPSEQPTPH